MEQPKEFDFKLNSELNFDKLRIIEATDSSFVAVLVEHSWRRRTCRPADY